MRRARLQGNRLRIRCGDEWTWLSILLSPVIFGMALIACGAMAVPISMFNQPGTIFARYDILTSLALLGLASFPLMIMGTFMLRHILGVFLKPRVVELDSDTRVIRALIGVRPFVDTTEMSYESCLRVRVDVKRRRSKVSWLEHLVAIEGLGVRIDIHPFDDYMEATEAAMEIASRINLIAIVIEPAALPEGESAELALAKARRRLEDRAPR